MSETPRNYRLDRNGVPQLPRTEILRMRVSRFLRRYVLPGYCYEHASSTRFGGCMVCVAHGKMIKADELRQARS